MKKIITKNRQETQEFAKKVAKNLRGGEVICLEGDLGSGKTTFTQGLLEELGARGPYTSPTFVVMKKYDLEGLGISDVYHIDAYRMDAKGLLDLGWEEISQNDQNVVVVEWPEKMEGALPESALWITFHWVDEDEREIVFDDRLEI